MIILNKRKKIVGIDPGKEDLIYCVDGTSFKTKSRKNNSTILDILRIKEERK